MGYVGRLINMPPATTSCCITSSSKLCRMSVGESSSAMSQIICTVCAGALEHRLTRLTADHVEGREKFELPNDFGHHRSIASLNASVKSNCWICSRIEQSVDLSEHARRFSALDFNTNYTKTIGSHGFLTIITVKVPDKHGCTKGGVYYMYGQNRDRSILQLSFHMMEVTSGRGKKICRT